FDLAQNSPQGAHPSQVLPQSSQYIAAITCQLQGNALDRRVQCVKIIALRRQCDHSDIPSLARPVVGEVGCDTLGAAAAQRVDEEEEFQLIGTANSIDIRRKHPTSWKIA